MKGLSMGDWSLIARYLKDEANSGDLIKVDLLMDDYPNLRMELDMLTTEINTPKFQPSVNINVDLALNKLNQRFVQEKLL